MWLQVAKRAVPRPLRGPTERSNRRLPIQHRGHCDLELSNCGSCETRQPSISKSTIPESRNATASRNTPTSREVPESPIAFSYPDPNMLSSLQNPRQAAAQLMNFGLILSTAFMVRHPPPLRCASHLTVRMLTNPGRQMWKGLSVISDSPSPIVVVLSGSMEPAFQRGDLLLLWNRNLFSETSVGEIVVYNVRGKDIPIVHRIVRKFGTGCVFAAGQPVEQVDTGVGADGYMQAGCKAPYQGRQQCGGRHGALRARPGLP